VSGVTALTASALEALPVFPLPRTVFFPGTKLPLHLFEPRYRAMIRDCLEHGPRAMAVTLLGPGWESDYEGHPPIHLIAGAGRVIGHARNPDGTHDILLDGVARVRLDELPQGELPYRRARATVLDDRSAHDPVASSEVAALLTAASSVVTALRKAHPTFELGLAPGLSPGRIADVIADRLVAEPGARQALLETLDAAERVRAVTDVVVELLGVIGPGGPRGGELAH